MAAVSIRALVRNALRMRPDRIVIGEVRGAEAMDLLLALNTGHRGALTTLHANSPADAIRRIEALALMAEIGFGPESLRSQIVAALDLILHLERGAGGDRVAVTLDRGRRHQRRAASAERGLVLGERAAADAARRPGGGALALALRELARTSPQLAASAESALIAVNLAGRLGSDADDVRASRAGSCSPRLLGATRSADLRFRPAGPTGVPRPRREPSGC